MTNTDEIQKRIDESGLKLSFIATKMSLSRSSLYNKIHNLTPFNQFEIDSLCSILNLTLEEKEQIFFAHNVRKKDYKRKETES